MMLGLFQALFFMNASAGPNSRQRVVDTERLPRLFAISYALMCKEPS
jgi:hypothetical protein